MARRYTLSEAAAITSKSHAALRAMADRGQLKVTGGGRRGVPRMVVRSELERVGILLETEEADYAALHARVATLEQRIEHMLFDNERLARVLEELQRAAGSVDRPRGRSRAQTQLPVAGPVLVPDEAPVGRHRTAS